MHLLKDMCPPPTSPPPARMPTHSGRYMIISGSASISLKVPFSSVSASLFHYGYPRRTCVGMYHLCLSDIITFIQRSACSFEGMVLCFCRSSLICGCRLGGVDSVGCHLTRRSMLLSDWMRAYVECAVSCREKGMYPYLDKRTCGPENCRRVESG